MGVEIVIACSFAMLASGLAWGYRGQRDLEREQVTYLRKQLASEPPPKPGAAAHPSSSRALTSVP